MSVINQVSGSATSIPQNMGGKKQYLEAPVKTVILAKDTFSFANIAAVKLVANYKTGVTAKGLVPFPNVEGIELANTEESIKNGRYTDYTLKEGVAGVKYRFDVSVNSYEALKSFRNSEFTRVFEITEAEEVTCDVQDDGTVKGRKMTSFLVGLRNQATDADVPYADVNIKYDDDVFDILRAEFDATDVEGIYDVNLEIVSQAAGEIKVKATVESGSSVTTLVQADWKFVQDSDGLEEAITGSSYDAATGEYTLTAAAFETGKLSTDGVIQQAEITYEAASVTVTI